MRTRRQGSKMRVTKNAGKRISRFLIQCSTRHTFTISTTNVIRHFFIHSNRRSMIQFSEGQSFQMGSPKQYNPNDTARRSKTCPRPCRPTNPPRYLPRCVHPSTTIQPSADSLPATNNIIPSLTPSALIYHEENPSASQLLPFSRIRLQGKSMRL